MVALNLICDITQAVWMCVCITPDKINALFITSGENVVGIHLCSDGESRMVSFDCVAATAASWYIVNEIECRYSAVQIYLHLRLSFHRSWVWSSTSPWPLPTSLTWRIVPHTSSSRNLETSHRSPTSRYIYLHGDYKSLIQYGHTNIRCVPQKLWLQFVIGIWR